MHDWYWSVVQIYFIHNTLMTFFRSCSFCYSCSAAEVRGSLYLPAYLTVMLASITQVQSYLMQPDVTIMCNSSWFLEIVFSFLSLALNGILYPTKQLWQKKSPPIWMSKSVFPSNFHIKLPVTAFLDLRRLLSTYICIQVDIQIDKQTLCVHVYVCTDKRKTEKKESSLIFSNGERD